MPVTKWTKQNGLRLGRLFYTPPQAKPKPRPAQRPLRPNPLFPADIEPAALLRWILAQRSRPDLPPSTERNVARKSTHLRPPSRAPLN
jgi:hypothetical protein